MSPGRETARRTRMRTHARSLRQKMTDAEARLWYYLRDRRMEGYKFRRQHRIGGFIADFACVEAGLVIEADGGQHGERQDHDYNRTRALQDHGFRVVRFWNHDILTQTSDVLEQIHAALAHADTDVPLCLGKTSDQRPGMPRKPVG